MYKPSDSPELKEMANFIIPIKTDNLDQMKQQLTKSFTGMMKAGAQKTADIMIPQNQKFNRLK